MEFSGEIRVARVLRISFKEPDETLAVLLIE